MSAHDPYAPVSKPAVEEADASVTLPEATAVEAQEAPQTEEPTVPEGSIKDVLSWVGEDPTKAQIALDAENSGEKRKTLIKELNVILDK
jgi:hypothetical protein